MLKKIFLKLFSSFIALSGVILLAFFFLKFVPGGPFDLERPLQPEVQNILRHQYGLDQPVMNQFFLYLQNIAKGELGVSYASWGALSVKEIVLPAFWVSLELGLLTLFWVIPLGLLLAFRFFLNPSQWGLLLFQELLMVPSFFVAGLFMFVFSLQLGWFPAGLLDGPLSWVLPSLSLGLRPLALIVVYLVEHSRSDFYQQVFRYSLSLGMSPQRAYMKGVLPRLLPQIREVFVPLFSHVLTGSFIIENVFTIPGLGKYFVSSLLDRDYPIVLATVLLFTLVFLLFYLLLDLCLIAFHILDVEEIE